MPGVPLTITHWPLLLVAAFIVGSIPFAQILARINGVDLREVGSGNVGAGNLTRNVGLPWGIAAAVFDGLKGLLPVLIATRSGLGPGAAGLAGVAAVVGHNWSIFMKGRAGRGLATAFGMTLALNPPLVVWATGWAIAGWRIGGGLGGLVGWGLLPGVAVLLGAPVTETLVLLLLSAIIVGRRMQGNPGDAMDLSSMMRRAIFDTDPASAPDSDPLHDQVMP